MHKKHQRKTSFFLITDDAGINTWRAASYYRHGAFGHEVYDNFDVKAFMSTYPLNTSNTPTNPKDGKALKAKDDKAYRYVGGKETWNKLNNGETDYILIETKEDFEKLANGKFDRGDKSKLIGTVQNHLTTQFNRPGVDMGQQLNNQTSLATMTKGAEFFRDVAKKDASSAAYHAATENQIYVDNTGVFRASLAAFGPKETQQAAKSE